MSIQARRCQIPSLLTHASNASLLVTRYLECAADKTERAKSARQDILGTAQKTIDSANRVYDMAFKRWQSCLPPNGHKLEFQTEDNSRLILGLGGHNVLEAGITLHHVYGVPFIPGTALKGLASHHYGTILHGNDPNWNAADDDFRRVVFGSQNEGGLVTFHDAWLDPISLATCLVEDVMTPHHSSYYGGNQDHPTEFDDPIPVSYLTVVGKFHSYISGNLLSEEWLKRTKEILKMAVAEVGIGAKTASGYGRCK